MVDKPLESRKPEKSGLGTGIKIVIGVIFIVIVIGVVAILTLNVSVMSPDQGVTYPYSTHFAVSIPEGQQVTIGNAMITVLSYQNELVADVNGNRQKLVVGEDRVLTEKNAKITTLGAPLLQTNFQISLNYTGELNNRAYFNMDIKTQRQVPDFILNHILPATIEARAI